MEIKEYLVLHGMTWAAAQEIKYNTIGAFQTVKSNTPGYYIVRWTGNAYTLQEKYTCHTFYPPVLIHEGELVCPSKFMNPTRKTSYWYKDPDEEIPVMGNFKQVFIIYIEFIQNNNKKIICHHVLKYTLI